MKRFILITAGIIPLFLCSTCKKEHVAPINQLVKDLFCFKTGSEWTYYDSVSQTTQKMVVTNYESLKFAPMPKGGGKAYDFAEYIKMDIIAGDSKKETSLLADRHQDNMAAGSIVTPADADFSLQIRCDENNNFTPSATYLSTYVLNETTYSDVYMFNSTRNITYAGNVTYYVAKHIGLIRYIYQGEYQIYNFDWVLINKNVQQ